MTDDTRTPCNPAGLVDCQAGSIVSRQILKKPGGSVTVFAFDEGESLSEHSTPHDALVHLVEGEAKIRVAGETHTVVAGEMLHLPAGVPHAVHAATRFKMVLTMIRSEV